MTLASDNRMGMQVIAALSEGLVRVQHIHGRQLWATGKIRKTKNHPEGRKCVLCRELKPVGTNMWREATQCSMQRMLRVCDPCMQKLIKECYE